MKAEKLNSAFILVVVRLAELGVRSEFLITLSRTRSRESLWIFLSSLQEKFFSKILQ
jgi:hypothetical protein